MNQKKVIEVAKQVRFATKIIQTHNLDYPFQKVDIQYSAEPIKGTANLFKHTNENMLVAFRFCIKNRIEKITMVVK